MDWSNIFESIVGSILAALVLFFLSLLVLDEKKRFRPYVQNLPNSTFARILKYLLWLKDNLFSQPFRAVYLLADLVLIYFFPSALPYYAIGVFLAISFFITQKPAYAKLKRPGKTDIDAFDKELTKWDVVGGSPKIEQDFGKPQPALGFRVVNGSSTNSFLTFKKTLTSGIIEYDYYLEPDALLNLIVFADIEESQWYMARHDSRFSESDSILVKPANGVWRHISIGSSRSQSKAWHKGRVEFCSDYIKMYRDDELVTEITGPTQYGKKVGFFNEVAAAHVDNFSVAELK